MGAMGTYAATGSAQVTLAGIQTLIYQDTGWSRESIALAVTLGTWTAGFLTPLFGKLSDTLGPRLIMPISSIIIGLCFYVIAGMSAVWHFYLAYIIARGLGNPVLIGVMPRTVAVNFFNRRRNFALSLVSMARPCFGAINVQIITFIAVHSSWRTSYKLLGSYSILLFLPLILFMRRTPEEIGLMPDGKKYKGNIDGAKKSVEASGTSHSANPEDISWTTKETVRTTSFWLIVAAEFLIILTSGTIGFQIVPFLSDSGYSLKIAAAVWSISSLLNAFSNPLWGFLSDKYSPRKLVLCALCICITVTTTFLIFDPHQAGIISSILWGASSGGLTILGGMLIARYFGRKSFGTISGITGPFQTCGLGLGPILGAILYNTTEEYTILFVSAICFYLIAAILFLFAKRPTRINAL
ncbi:MFS transporter [Dehalococcoidia bacterium]|nr:MFS transporter [Dehalococcoidia bacterium]